MSSLRDRSMEMPVEAMPNAVHSMTENDHQFFSKPGDCRKSGLTIFGMIIHTFRFYSMKKYQLGEFEEVVLLTVAILNNEAYSVTIKDEIESRLARTISLGALHTALKRM